MDKFIKECFDLYDKKWALVTAGPTDNYNTMTISWGGIGTIWNKPAVTVYVKPVRYTHKFMDENEYFTVSFYGEEHRQALSLLGTKSGRDGDKVARAGFEPVATAKGATTFKQAEITLLCRKMYRQDLVRDTMDEDVIDKYYIDEEPHTMYIGEVVDIIK